MRIKSPHRTPSPADGEGVKLGQDHGTGQGSHAEGQQRGSRKAEDTGTG